MSQQYVTKIPKPHLVLGAVSPTAKDIKRGQIVEYEGKRYTVTRTRRDRNSDEVRIYCNREES